MRRDDRSVEESLRLVALCAAMHPALSAARLQAERLFVPESLSRR